MTTLPLATFNALSGRSLRSPDADPLLLARSVAELGADIVALQEVDRGLDRSGGRDQARLVAEAMGPDVPAFRFVATVHGTPGLPGWVPAIRPGNQVLDPAPAPEVPSYGIALVSRIPVERWLALGFGGTPGRYPLLVPGVRPQVMWLEDEPRAVLAAVLERPRITVACAHLTFVPVRNAYQLRRVVSWLRTLPGPRLLLGDLNLPGGLPVRLTGWTSLVSAPTYPSTAPRLQLDHMLADGLPPSARVRDGAAVRLPVSDHCAAVATLHLPS